ALAYYMRHVVGHPEEARAKGRAGQAHVHAHFTWDQAADVVEARLRELRQRPLRRLTRPTSAGVGAPPPTDAGADRPAVARPAPPAGDELASLIILCCNEVDYTRLCLESVFRHTRAPDAR